MTMLISMSHPARSFSWTAPVSVGSEMTTEDPLGLDYISQQVGLLLLPNLTTRSTRAQAFAMVAYGLDLAERAVERHGLPNTEEQKRALFERWERFWALATLEFKGGQLPRGDWDAMRGVRGAKAAWRSDGNKQPMNFTLISRQQELGNLGAYLAPLRRSRLVVSGGMRPTPAALEIIDCFWDEPEKYHRSRYDEYALEALVPERSHIERSFNNLSLARVGERSRLTTLVTRRRVEQQRRLYAALFEQACDATTHPIAQLVEAASKAEITAPREILEGCLAGRFGQVDSALRELLVTAREFGDFYAELLGAFDRLYATLHNGGWVIDRVHAASSVFTTAQRAALQRAAARLLDAPAVSAIRRLPMHGAGCLRMAEELRSADAGTALDLLLAYHGAVQRDRRRGGAWITEDAGKLTLFVTSYTARPDAPRFPAFKLDVVRTLLVDTGHLPFTADEVASEVGA